MENQHRWGAQGTSWELLSGAFLANLSSLKWSLLFCVKSVRYFCFPVLLINTFLWSHIVFYSLEGCLAVFQNSNTLPMSPICDSNLVLSPLHILISANWKNKSTSHWVFKPETMPKVCTLLKQILCSYLMRKYMFSLRTRAQPIFTIW